MANGRLGKAVLTPDQTTAVYTNSSGAEASVSVVAQSTNGASMYLRIDDSSDPLQSTTTLVTEAFDDRYLKYDVSNTTLDSGTPTYGGRFQFHDTTSATNLDAIFEYYDADAATLRTIQTQNQYNITNAVNPAFGVRSSDVPVLLVPQSSNAATIHAYTMPTTAASYYQIALGPYNSGISIANQTISRSNRGISIDTYSTDRIPVFSMDVSGYMGCLVYDVSTNSWGSNTQTTNSIAYTFGIRGGTSPSDTIQPSIVRAAKRTIAVDGSSNASNIIVGTVADSVYNGANINSVASDIINYYSNHMFFLNLNNNYSGGNILYHEYNADNDRYYLGYRSNGVGYVLSYDRTLLLNRAQGSPLSLSTAGSDTTYDIQQHTFTLPLSSYSLGTSALTFRSCQIGPSLWALTCFTNGLAPEVFLSTDLMTWVTPSTYYSPNDYSETVGATAVLSNAGVVTATKSNILSLGTDGVLEQGVPFSQYERTGLVLSNGDRIVAYNDINSSDDISIQVMGYEGN